MIYILPVDIFLIAIICTEIEWIIMQCFIQGGKQVSCMLLNGKAGIFFVNINVLNLMTVIRKNIPMANVLPS